MKKCNPRIVCKDGFSISVQARSSAYCTPREDYPNTPYTDMECGFPSSNPITKEFRNYAEGYEDKESYCGTVFSYVPIEVIEKELEEHGGIVEGSLPSSSECDELQKEIDRLVSTLKPLKGKK